MDYSVDISNYNNYVYDYLYNNNMLGTFTNEFNNKNINSIYEDIQNNRTLRVDNKDLYFKKILRESDIVVINIGMSELASNYNKYDMNMNNDTFKKIYLNVQKVVSELKKYAKGTIIFIGLHNPTNYYDASVDSFFNSIGNSLSKLLKNNDAIYLDVYEFYKNDRNIVGKKIAEAIEYYI